MPAWHISAEWNCLFEHKCVAIVLLVLSMVGWKSRYLRHCIVPVQAFWVISQAAARMWPNAANMSICRCGPLCFPRIIFLIFND